MAWHIKRVGKFVTVGLAVTVLMVLMTWLSLRFADSIGSIGVLLNRARVPLLFWRLLLYVAIVWLLYKAQPILVKHSAERRSAFTKIAVCFAILAALCEYSNYMNLAVAK